MKIARRCLEADLRKNREKSRNQRRLEKNIFVSLTDPEACFARDKEKTFCFLWISTPTSKGLFIELSFLLYIYTNSRLVSEGHPWLPMSSTALRKSELPPTAGLLLALLRQASAGFEQNASQKFPSGRGAHAANEVTISVQQGRGELSLSDPASQIAREFFFVKPQK